MKKDRRQEILLKALELFATYGYESVSITDMQLALDMGRGTLYYYFKSKDELFTTVVDEFFIKPKEKVMELPDTIDVPQMIEAVLGYTGFLRETLMKFENKNLNTSSAVTLMYTAYNKFPELYKKASRLYARELNLWKIALTNSIKQNQIREDIPIETVAIMFTHLKDGYDVGQSGVTMDFSIFPQQYQNLYSLLKPYE